MYSLSKRRLLNAPYNSKQANLQQTTRVGVASALLDASDLTGIEAYFDLVLNEEDYTPFSFLANSASLERQKAETGTRRKEKAVRVQVGKANEVEVHKRLNGVYCRFLTRNRCTRGDQLC
ncbi:hypothetical protein EVAR_80524_1 [Eumeta japonica]|uniref:Uncharacterized protein n=1 Tax=Eumeta variegata TaxID=151549 RepID=A0A4C1TMN6_EUMVA|nr:hypothetical protein EVAR_80524_1 [Eumeta japonica]